ncbi:hypothetical protein E2C01_003329 [Portunus trituberculatus]|uniref:Uncharacterized protein n=1 Tax=Portunus trituberculatus TaxID=210409 RepID=A0A5B7CMG2_PORTR|nr:hypothetical protein [Portunus trituberculatus]
MRGTSPGRAVLVVVVESLLGAPCQQLRVHMSRRMCSMKPSKWRASYRADMFSFVIVRRLLVQGLEEGEHWSGIKCHGTSRAGAWPPPPLTSTCNGETMWSRAHFLPGRAAQWVLVSRSLPTTNLARPHAHRRASGTESD